MRLLWMKSDYILPPDTGGKIRTYNLMRELNRLGPLTYLALKNDGTPDDDPNLYMVVTRDADASGAFAKSVAHERGHNSCLPHVDVDECQLMRPGAGGGCLAASECADLSAGRILLHHAYQTTVLQWEVSCALSFLARRH